MQYRTMDGKVFRADSPEGLAEQLRQSQFVPPPDLTTWMAGSADRAHLYNGAEIRTDTVENHIADLIEAGFLEVLG